MSKLKEVFVAVYEAKAVRMAFKALIGAAVVAAAAVFGFDVSPETISGLLG